MQFCLLCIIGTSLFSVVACFSTYYMACSDKQANAQVKELNLEEGGAFTVSSADEILSAL